MCLQISHVKEDVVIKRVGIIAGQDYREGAKCSLLIGTVLMTEVIENLRHPKVANINGHTFKFGQWAVAFFPAISGGIGAAGNSGETPEELQREISSLANDHRDYFEEVRVLTRTFEKDPVLAISAECGV